MFNTETDAVADFAFNAQVAQVFDDMLGRSVPFYGEMQRMIAEMAAEYAVKGTRVYDLGCSTGTTLLNLGRAIEREVSFVGLDYSAEMLDKCREKLKQHGFDRPHELSCADLNNPLKIENASVVLMVLTLQFIRPIHRERLLREIYAGLQEGGCLILIEKVLGGSSLLNRQFIKFYYDFKRRNGYSELEIAQKREALENVLVPYSVDENRDLLLRQGFRHCDTFFKWYNFAGLVAVK
ncbi:carboxy-S-adenosyl-L-methionine synthase CmoA [Methylococcus sp. EFPC2]|nr:carboxy-S-adenosyl-L-methionine synthase CmoA [Methylococcus sp. EFPC2]